MVSREDLNVMRAGAEVGVLLLLAGGSVIFIPFCYSVAGSWLLVGFAVIAVARLAAIFQRLYQPGLICSFLSAIFGTCWGVALTTGIVKIKADFPRILAFPGVALVALATWGFWNIFKGDR